jgi:putative DNA primase/helicase
MTLRNPFADDPDGVPAVAGRGLSPEKRAAVRAKLEAFLATIRDPETRRQYAADWKELYEEAFPTAGAERFFDITPPDPLDLAWLPCNDYGNACRLDALAGENLKWVDDKCWVAFVSSAGRWSEAEGSAHATRMAIAVSEHIREEANALSALIGDPEAPNLDALVERFGDWCNPQMAIDRVEALHKLAVRSGNAGQTRAMLDQAKCLENMRASLSDFDRDPLAYNVRNGTLRFYEEWGGIWAVELTPHNPGDMLMQIADVEYDDTAQCPQWKARLEQVQPDTEQRGILPLVYGQCLTGLTDGQEIFIHQGQGGDGKSITHQVLAAVHGDYYSHSPVKTWLAATFQKSGSEHRSDLVRLAGDKRMVVSEEPPKNAVWDSETIKQVTGGGSITARGSGAAREITYEPRFKINIEVNKLPAAPSDDRGWWRRQVIIVWPIDTSLLPGGAEPPSTLKARLLTEKSGILNWLIAGCLQWLMVRKVPKVAIMEAAISSARAGSSPLAEWLAEECDVSDRTAKEGATALYKAFEAWCLAQGIDNYPKQAKFGRELTDRQIYVEKDRRGNMRRCGIRLRASDPLIEGASPHGLSGVDYDPFDDDDPLGD